MTDRLRLVLVLLLGAHAAIHLLGAAKGLGWAAVPQLQQPIGVLAGWTWLVAATATALAAALLAAGVRGWWFVAAAAAVVSQAVIASAWHDAKAGTVVNVVLLVAVLLGYAAGGPHGFDAQWQANLHPLTGPDQGGERIGGRGVGTRCRPGGLPCLGRSRSE